MEILDRPYVHFTHTLAEKLLKDMGIEQFKTDDINAVYNTLRAAGNTDYEIIQNVKSGVNLMGLSGIRLLASFVTVRHELLDRLPEHEVRLALFSSAQEQIGILRNQTADIELSADSNQIEKKRILNRNVTTLYRFQKSLLARKGSPVNPERR